MYNLYTRYLRQIILPDIGFIGQDLLKKSKVLCIGVGGLGSSALLHLVSAGVGYVGIVDFDVVDISNLNRQIVFNQSDLGKKKVFCAKKRMLDFNKDANIFIYDTKISYSNYLSVMSSYDIILDCTDNLESKFLISDCAIKLNIPLIHGSVFGFEGYVSMFLKNKFCFRCLYKSFFDFQCISYGILGPVAGITGSIQALEAIKWLLNSTTLSKDFRHLVAKLFILDFKTLTFKVLKLKKDINCVVC